MEPIYWAIPLVTGILLIIVFAWRRWMAWRKRLERLPDGTVALYRERKVEQIRAQLIGAFMLVGIGSYGAKQVQRLLVVLWQCGLDALVGSVLVIENDAQLRARFHESIPDVYHDRIVYGYSDTYAGGMSNRPVAWVLERVDTWGVALDRAVADVIDLHLRRNGGRAPSDVFLKLSLGGHGPLGLLVVEQLHDRFEESQVVAFTTLPSTTRLRDRYPELKSAYEQRGVIGWVLSDNLGDDPTTADFGMIATIGALADAALHADQGAQPNNAFALALTREPGAVLVYQVVAANVVAYPHQPYRRRPPLAYYVFQPQLVEQVTKSLRAIEQGKGAWSATLPIGEPDTTTFDILMTSVWHDDLLKVQDDVVAGRKLRAKNLLHGRNGHDREPGVLFGQPNYETPFASIATVINPDRPVCPVVAVRLTAVRDGAQIVDEIVKAPQERSLPAPSDTLPILDNGTRPAEPVRSLASPRHDPAIDESA